MKSPKVSVIVTTKNESAHIRPCLVSIQKQTYPSVEIIVVDNHSSDKTKEIAREYSQHVYDAGPERSAQRNFGAAKATGEYLVFLDADMIVTPNVVSECVDTTTRGGYAGLVIPEKSIGRGFWARCKILERECYEGIVWMEAARFYTKEAFIKAGKFNEQLTGPEDFEFSQRVKVRFGEDSIGRISPYILHDEGHLSLAKLLRKKYYYGMQMHRYRRTPGSREYFQKQSNPLLRYWLYFRHPFMFVRDPLHAFGMLGMKLLEMSALALGAMRGRGHYA